MRAAPCYGGPEDLGDCVNAAFEPAGQLGAACEQFECLDGFCPQGPGLADSCRACTAYAAMGQSCTTPNSCNPNVGYCPASSSDGGARVCEVLRGPGDACLTGLECAGRAQCVSFTALDGGIPRCGPNALGSPCAGVSDCGAGAYCKGLRIASDSTITPGICTSRLPLNAVCVNEQFDDHFSRAKSKWEDLKEKSKEQSDRRRWYLLAASRVRELRAALDAKN